MTIDPIMYGNLMLTVIAVLLFLLFLTGILILIRLKKAFPAKEEEKTKKRFKKAQKAVINEETKENEEETHEPEPSELYQNKSIEQNLIELFKHYSLNSFTMATSDGLVISSTDSDPDEDAANYSYLYLQGKQPESANVRLIGVPHKGGTVIGIIKSDDDLSEKDLVLIERDIRYILRRNL